MKMHTNLSIDQELYSRGKELNLNFSQLLEDAIISKFARDNQDVKKKISPAEESIKAKYKLSDDEFEWIKANLKAEFNSTLMENWKAKFNKEHSDILAYVRLELRGKVIPYG